jgi:hypothetical protein
MSLFAERLTLMKLTLLTLLLFGEIFIDEVDGSPGFMTGKFLQLAYEIIRMNYSPAYICRN